MTGTNADRVQAEDIPKASNGWQIASHISFAAIVSVMLQGGKNLVEFSCSFRSFRRHRSGWSGILANTENGPCDPNSTGVILYQVHGRRSPA